MKVVSNLNQGSGGENREIWTDFQYIQELELIGLHD
jgi:hypothetical protein